MGKLITFAVPCYNSQPYMRKCIDSLLPGGKDVEILIVDDGSSDETAAIADAYERDYPDICRAIHQENAGHGGAVNTGLANAHGLYFKVVDSDDWVDADSYRLVLDRLRGMLQEREYTDIFITNYVYEHVSDGKSHTIGYKKVLPQDRLFGWDETRHFRMDQNLLMHAVIYRTKALRESGLKLPEHTFYVDNLFVYLPLPYMKKLYYVDTDFYRYFIGRDDQSVNERVMISRIDQQIRVNKIMIDAYNLPKDAGNKHLARYMVSYLAMICCVTSIMLIISGTPEHLAMRKELWEYFKKKHPGMYWRVRLGVRGIVSNPPGKISFGIVKKCYRMAKRIYKFN